MLKANLNRKGISLMVSYVLLIVFAVILGAIIFVWLKTYVPSETLSCPEGVSVFAKENSFNDSTRQFKLILKNNGRFDIAGFFIHGTNSSTQEIPTTDFSLYLNESLGSGGRKFGNSVVYVLGQNSMNPADTRTNLFDIPLELGKPISSRVIPVRYQTDNGRTRFVSCGDAKIQQLVTEPIVECVPEAISVTCGTRVCGSRVNNCGDLVSCPPGCSGTDVCNAIGSCVPPAQCTDTCSTFGYTCGTWTICGVQTTCGSLGGACPPGSSCNAIGQCVPLCGNGIINTGEACDDGNTNPGDGCSDSCQIEGGWTCSGQPSTCLRGGAGGSFNSCGDYCDTFQGYSAAFSCVQNPQQCAGLGKVWIGDVPGSNATYGDSLCTGGNADTCCCTPG